MNIEDILKVLGTGGVGVAAIFVAAWWTARKDLLEALAFNRQQQEKHAAINLDLQVTMVKLQQALEALKATIELMR